MYNDIETQITTLQELLTKLIARWAAQVQVRESVYLINVSLRQKANDQFPLKSLNFYFTMNLYKNKKHKKR